jgi:hypothetical protein
MPDAWETRFGLDPAVNDAAADPDRDGTTNVEEYRSGGHPRGYFKRYLAEGATGSFFTSELDLFNVDRLVDTIVTVRFFGSSGPLASYDLALPRGGRHTIVVDELPGLLDVEFSSVFESEVEVVVERRMFWDDGRYGSHATSAATALSSTWSFAEGVTHPGFDSFLLLFNPHAEAVDAWVTHVFSDRAAQVTGVRIPPQSRLTVWSGYGIPGMDDAEFGSQVSTTCPALAVCSSQGSGLPIVAEQAVYYSRPDRLFDAGAATTVAPAPSTDWSFAEGSVGYFDTFLLLANFADSAATIDARFRLPDGRQVARTITLPARSRRTLWLDWAIPELNGSPFSLSLYARNGVPFVAARSMWWPAGGGGAWQGATLESGTADAARLTTDSGTGANDLGLDVALAGLDGSPGTSNYLLIDNNGSSGSASITMTLDGSAQVSRVVNVPAETRTTVDLAALFPEFVGHRASTRIQSQGFGPQSLDLDAVTTYPRLLVEHAHFSDVGSSRWEAGDSRRGTDATEPTVFVSVFGVTEPPTLAVGQRLDFRVLSPWGYNISPDTIPGAPPCPRKSPDGRYLEPGACGFVVCCAFLSNSGPIHRRFWVR